MMADHKKEMIEMARRCSQEIKDLRAHIARLQPKAEAYDNLVAVLRLLPQPPQGYSEDLAWMLDKRVNELTREEGVQEGVIQNPESVLNPKFGQPPVPSGPPTHNPVG